MLAAREGRLSVFVALAAILRIIGYSNACFAFVPTRSFSSAAATASSRGSAMAASSTATSTGGQTGVSSSSQQGEVLEPEGTHHAWWSLAPLIEAGQWSSSPGEYFKSKSDAVGGAPIFKCHPGLASIAITDHASGQWFFNQPDSVLDRQVGANTHRLPCMIKWVNVVFASFSCRCVCRESGEVLRSLLHMRHVKSVSLLPCSKTGLCTLTMYIYFQKFGQSLALFEKALIFETARLE